MTLAFLFIFFTFFFSKNFTSTKKSKKNQKKQKQNSIKNIKKKQIKKTSNKSKCKTGKQHKTCKSALCTVDDASCILVIRLGPKTSECEKNVIVVSTATGCDVTYCATTLHGFNKHKVKKKSKKEKKRGLQGVSLETAQKINFCFVQRNRAEIEAKKKSNSRAASSRILFASALLRVKYSHIPLVNCSFQRFSKFLHDVPSSPRLLSIATSSASAHPAAAVACCSTAIFAWSLPFPFRLPT